MVAPRRVLLGLCFATAPAAAFQPARVSSQHRHSVAVHSTIDNRRRSRSDNEASEGLGIVNVPVTEDAIKMAKEKLDSRPGSVASAATASADAGNCFASSSSSLFSHVNCLPGLVNIGVQKAGTGELQNWLAAHPSVVIHGGELGREGACKGH